MMNSRIVTFVCLAVLLWPRHSLAQHEEGAARDHSSAAASAADAVVGTANETGTSAADISKAIGDGQAEVASNSALDATLKSSLQQLYQAAQQSLQAATASKRNAAHFTKMSRDAKQDFKQLGAELQQPVVKTIEIRADERADSISQRLAQANAELTTATNYVETLAGEPLRRQQRLAEIPGDLAAAEKELTDTTEQLSLAAPANEKPIETHARVASLQARALAAKSRIDELQQEQSAYTSTSDVLPLRKSLADQRVNLLHTQIDALQAALVRRQTAEGRDTTDGLRADLGKISGPLKKLAQSNIELSEQHQQLISDAAQATQSLDDIREATQTTQAELKTSRERVKAVGLTDALGLMLRTRRGEYEQLRQKYVPRAELKDRIQHLQVVSFELEDELSNIDDLIAAAQSSADADNAVSSGAAIGSSTADVVPDRLDLLKKRKQLLGVTLQSQNALLQALLNGDTQRRLLLQEIDLYINFIDEQVFWIRNSPAFSFAELQYAPAAFGWMIQPGNWVRVGQNAITTLGRHPLNCLLAVVAIVALFVARRRLRKVIDAAAVETHRYNATFRPTLQALAATLLLASVWPAVFAFGGGLLADRIHVDSFVYGVGTGLFAVALFVAPRELLRVVCRNEGLGEAHFGWNDAVGSMLRFHLRWYTLLGSVLVFLIVLWHANPDKQVRLVTERLTSVSLFAIFAVFNHFVFRPRSPMFVQLGSNRPESTLYHIRHYVWGIMLGVPLLLVGMSMAGYLDTAFRLGRSIQFSLILLVVVVLLVALVFRWLTLRYRDIAIKQAREKREKQRAAAVVAMSDADSLTEAVGIDLVEKEATDLPALDRQTRQTVSTLATVLSLIALAMIWREVLPALDVLDRVQIRSVGVGAEIRVFTLKDVFLIVAVIAATIYAVRTLPGVLEMIVLQRSSLDSGARYAWATILRYLLIVAGAIIVMNMLSVPYQQLGWLLAAASVGLGFGMQEIFANFVSGIILLLERPVRVGDVVTIGETTGVVSRIKMRATTVTSWDRKELVVPNKDLITEKLLNWSLSNVINRVTLNVGVDYSADPDKVRGILEHVVGLHPDVMDDPAPIVNFEQFGDNSLNFAVRFFLANLDRRIGVTHEINASILRALRKAKIDIPYPQRDLHIKVASDPSALPIELRRKDATPPDV